MKNKKIILFLFFSVIFVWLNILIASEVLAAQETQKNQINFIPAITIPGFYDAKASVPIDGSSLAKYIVALYRYGGMFAGVVAMFMLVYAGWEWLLAGGNPSKISRAKEKINGTLIGLVILFGGYLLLSLISTRLISFDPIKTEIADIPCALYQAEKTCPVTRCHWVPDNIITINNATGCVDGTVNIKPACSIQQDSTSCDALSNICEWDTNKCIVKETCGITQEDFTLFANDSTVNASFNIHCCATDVFGGGYSNYRYAIFGNRDRNLSCAWVCGAGSPERPLNECKDSLGWDGAMDGSGGW